MANSIATIEKYLRGALDTILAESSKTAILEGSSKWVDVNFDMAGTVKVARILMDGLSDYKRGNSATSADAGYQNYNASGVHGDGYKAGNASLEWETYKLAYDRGKQFQIDRMDDEETAGLMIGNLLAEFIRTKVVPEIDEIRFSRMAQYAGTSVSEAVADNTILSKFIDAFEVLTENEVPDDDQVIFVNPAISTLMQKSAELSKLLIPGVYKPMEGVEFNINYFNGRPVIVVPSKRFFTNVGLGSNGYFPQASSYVINFLVCSKSAIVPIVKLETAKVFAPEVVQDFDGYKANLRIYHDALILENKKPAIYVSVSTTLANTKTSLLSVEMDGLAVASYSTTPRQLLGTLRVHTADFGAIGTTTALGTAIAVGEETTAGTKYFALVDGNGVILAKSGSVVVAG